MKHFYLSIIITKVINCFIWENVYTAEDILLQILLQLFCCRYSADTAADILMQIFCSSICIKIAAEYLQQYLQQNICSSNSSRISGSKYLQQYLQKYLQQNICNSICSNINVRAILMMVRPFQFKALPIKIMVRWYGRSII